MCKACRYNEWAPCAGLCQKLLMLRLMRENAFGLFMTSPTPTPGETEHFQDLELSAWELFSILSDLI